MLALVEVVGRRERVGAKRLREGAEEAVERRECVVKRRVCAIESSSTMWVVREVGRRGACAVKGSGGARVVGMLREV